MIIQRYNTRQDTTQGKQKVTNEKPNFWSEVMNDACAKEFVDSNYVNKPNCIILIHSGNEPPLMCEEFF